MPVTQKWCILYNTVVMAASIRATELSMTAVNSDSLSEMLKESGKISLRPSKNELQTILKKQNRSTQVQRPSISQRGLSFEFRCGGS